MHNAIFSLPNNRFAGSPWAAIVESGTCGFCEFHKTPKKDWTRRKVQTPGQERIRTNGNEKEKFLPPGQPPVINRAWRPWYEIFPLASLGWLPGCASSQLLHTSSLAEYGKLEKVLDFSATAEKNWCYQHSSRTKSKTQQLLRRKLILSQTISGHPYS